MNQPDPYPYRFRSVAEAVVSMQEFDAGGGEVFELHGALHRRPRNTIPPFIAGFVTGPDAARANPEYLAAPIEIVFLRR